MATSTALSPGTTDVIVTLEDQERINRFAQLSAKLTELTEDSKSLKIELQNMEDLINELDMKMLEHDEEDGENRIDLLRGEVFVNLTCEEAQKWIEEKHNNLKEEIKSNFDKMESLREEMNSLKAVLYSKFGKNNIHLEADEWSNKRLWDAVLYCSGAHHVCVSFPSCYALM